MSTRETTVCEPGAALNQVVVGIAHELNNPNAFIRINATNLKKMLWLLRPCLEEYQERHPGEKLGPFTIPEIRSKIDGAVESILEATVRIIMVADKLKELTSAPLDQAAPVSLLDLVRQEIQHHRFYLERVTRLEVRAEPEGRYLVEGHRLQLGQAAAILLINGADAIQERYGEESPRKGLLLVELQEEGDRVLLRVRDNGTGMSPETLEKALTPYFTTKPQGKGDGLGLPICQSIVRRHGGELRLVSREGEGTEAVISLPRWKE